MALFLLVRPPGPHPVGSPGPRHWTSVQQEELQLQALATLASVAPLMQEEYVSCKGSTCLLLLLEWCAERGEISRGLGRNKR